jgi:choline monooxygenase
MSALRSLLETYDPQKPLAEASTLPAAFYLDPTVFELERSLLENNWHFAARADEVATPGSYCASQIGREPVMVVRGADGVLRAFANVCRHHAAAIVTGTGCASALRCPYHGWTYALDGELRGVPDFQGVSNFDRKDFGLVPLEVDTWESFVFVRAARSGPSLLSLPSLSAFLGSLPERVAALELGKLRFAERHEWELGCNWKVFVDNYLDGGYHVPHLHRGLAGALELSEYAIENGETWCLQSSPMKASVDKAVAQVRRGERAHYFWLYPNLMINVYEGMMDTNLVIPLAVDRTRVVFDFYFSELEGPEAEKNRTSIAVGRTIQEEDVAVCESVQRGLGSRAYGAGRLSVRREAGEHLFHRLLHADLTVASESSRR